MGLLPLQGVWGRAAPPNGEREGQSPLASLISTERRQWGARGAKPARRSRTHNYANSQELRAAPYLPTPSNLIILIGSASAHGPIDGGFNDAPAHADRR